MPRLSQELRERAIGMLQANMNVTAVARTLGRSLNSCESRGILLSLQVNSGELSICHRFVNKVVSLSMAVKVARAKVVKVYIDCLRR
jgi:hypothetical protein